MDTPSNPQQPEQSEEQKILLSLDTVNIENIQSPEAIAITQKAMLNPETKMAAIRKLQSLNPDVHKMFRDMEKKAKKPYYKEAYGRELIKNVLDLMLLTGKPRKFDGIHQKRWAVVTVDLKIRQAWEYVIDHLDPDKKYAILRSKTEIIRKPNLVAIIFKETDVSLTTSEFKEFSTVEDVLLLLKEIVENDMKFPYDRKYTMPEDWGDMEPFSLTTEELGKVEDFCMKFDFIKANVTSDRVSVVKYTPKDSIIGGEEG